MTPAESPSVAVELERMRGTFEAGLIKVDGKLDVLVERTSHTDRRLTTAESAISALTARVSALERRVWAASGGAAVIGVGGGYLFAMFGG